MKKPENVANLKQIFENASGEYLDVSPKGIFKKLECLTCVGMDLTWDQVSDVVPAFPVLQELILKDNKCTDFENIRFN